MSILDKLLKNTPPDKPYEPLRLRLPRGALLTYEYWCDFVGQGDAEPTFEMVKTTDDTCYYLKHLGGEFKGQWSQGTGDRPQSFEFVLAWHGELVVVQ